MEKIISKTITQGLIYTGFMAGTSHVFGISKPKAVALAAISGMVAGIAFDAIEISPIETKNTVAQLMILTGAIGSRLFFGTLGGRYLDPKFDCIDYVLSCAACYATTSAINILIKNSGLGLIEFN